MSDLILTDREAKRLANLEDSITRSASIMYDCMRAIHDEKLYRAEYATWEAYCKGRWNMSPQHANRLIEHGRILDLLVDDPKSEPVGSLSLAVTREVSGLPDDEKVEVLQQVAAESAAQNNGKAKVTAKAVKNKVASRKSRKPKQEPSLIKELDKAVSAVSRALAKAGEKHGEGKEYKTIFAAIGTIKKAVSEWKA